MATDALLYRLTDKESAPFPLYNELRETGSGRNNQTFGSEYFWHGASSHHEPDDPEHRRFVHPVAIIADIIGADPAEQADFRPWSQALAATFAPGIHGEAPDTTIRTASELIEESAACRARQSWEDPGWPTYRKD
ncbi:hypothetical protein [Saccharopolyspora pogona]|uniref:hypothetical protein n=1 Tax=Saccharopolyspora pogona TaxID=333966 RepID=UPI001687A216|nr:hypothetical protein [Saccharopolyspora pogona]